jgi:hypothetical protein
MAKSLGSLEHNLVFIICILMVGDKGKAAGEKGRQRGRGGRR